jgi:Tfp pilus assembly protein PilF
VDEKSDLALLRLDRPGHPALPLADDTERAGLRPVLDGGGSRLKVAGYRQPPDGADPDARISVEQREGVLIADRTDDGVTHLILGPTPDVGKGWSGGPLYRSETGAVVGVFHALVARKMEPGTWYPQSISTAQVEALLKQAGVTDLAPFRAPPAPARARAADADTLFRHEYRASALSVTQKWAEVELERRAILKLLPGSARAHNALAVTLQEQGKHEEALAEFAESLRLDPKRARTHLNYGLALLDLKRPKEAEESIRTATELTPDDADPWIALGRAYGTQQRRDEATAALRKAVELSPNHPLARWNLGISLVQGGRMEEGLAELREAVALSANFPPLRLMRLNLAQVLQATGQLDAAEAEYRGMLQTLSDNAAAHLYFATFLRSRGKNAEALSHARRCLELKPPPQLETAAQTLVKALGG